ncbi:DNA adenine methylase [Pleurocapsa sp. PCC 7319]|uniref:DNA adenine methylase n=1 Tax=Pleurocapsa sp. PCC 7319 TaxID=118161 RepID=UPI0003497D65|nr:DNA adenine methylase [Pleurocapsa sp. PCC 7319]
MVDCKPFIKWVGGKRKLLTELEKRVPSDFSAYFEPFMGGAALFWQLKPKPAILIDINQELVNAYRCVQQDVEALIVDLQKHHYDQKYYYQIRNSDRTSDYASWSNIQRASRFIYLNKTCFNGLYRVNSKGQYNVPFGRYKNPKIVDIENLRACSLALKDIEILTDSFLSIESKITKGDFVYFDPPYIPLNTTSSFTGYSSQGFDTETQIALRDLCLRLNKKGVRFMLSNSAAPLVFDLYSEFQIELVDMPRSINSKGDKRGKIKEVLITNY